METWVVWVVALCWFFVWGSIGATIGASKGRTFQGLLLGVGLSFIGVIVIGMMPPTDTKLAERDRAQARIVREVIGPAPVASASGSPGSVGVAITPQVRQQLLAVAISRDPSLAGASDAGTLTRLGESMVALETEYGLKWELAQLRGAQAAAAEAAARAEREQSDRLLAAQTRERDAREAALAQSRVETARVEQLAGMKPFQRWLTTHRPQVAVMAVIVVVGLVAGVVLATPPSGAGATPTPAQDTAGFPSSRSTPTPTPSSGTDGKVSAKYRSASDCTLLYGSADMWGSKLDVGWAVRWNYYVEHACALTPDPHEFGDEILILYSSYDEERKPQLVKGLWTARSRGGRGAVQWGDANIRRGTFTVGLTSSQKTWVRIQAERAAGRLGP